ncbi:putative lipoprotein [Leptospira ryugenii]|uniref:Putative lipoprotein n=1 Tax=Leptospira ryugenii TaxID=1917863 RepID=A0A2P2DX91_9LEPT|nr:putative lipoprotein [Leptospira ryugenii]
MPRSFLPQNAKYVNAIELRSGFSNPKEAYLSLESQDSMEEIQKVLETRSSFGDWKLVQKEKVDTKVVYLFEGFIKKSMTIIVYNKGDHRLLKYYFKKQTNY